MVKKIIIGLVGLVVLLAVVSLLLPRIVHVERSTTIAAPASVVFENIDELRNWPKWSPWHEKDPNCKYTYSDPSSGVGSWYSWEGDPKTVGTGTMKVSAVEPHKLIASELDFGKQGTATADFKFEETGGTTRVTWGCDSDTGMNPIARYFGLMMDSFLGPDFEKGLSNLKTLCEDATATQTDDVPSDEPAAP